MSGLMLLLDISHLPKSGRNVMVKIGNLIGKMKTLRCFTFIGKDNIVFHCIIFPAMLKAEGSYILPENVPANEFLNLEGQKLSTSKNWAVWLPEYFEEFPNQQDVLRYALNANAPETKDNDFTWKDFQARNNNELVAIFGNFINRVWLYLPINILMVLCQPQILFQMLTKLL